MKQKGIYIFLFLLFVSQIKVWSQQGAFTQLSVNEGLSHSDAICLTQDNYSYLWIGTNSGLNKYDGYSMETYKREPTDPRSIPSNRILKIISTKDKIWILIEHKGLYYYDLLKESYFLVVSIPSLVPQDFLFDFDRDKNLWLSQKSIGLIKISIPKFSNYSLDQIKKEKIFFLKNNTVFPNLKTLLTLNNTLYFINEDGKIYEYKSETNKLIAYDKISEGFYQTAISINSTKVLISFQNGLVLWDVSSKTKQNIPISSSFNTSKKIIINCVYKKANTLYIGTDNGLYSGRLVAHNGLKLVIDKEEIASIKVNDIIKDKFNVLWVASSGYGLFYSNLETLPFNHIKNYGYTKEHSVNDLSKNYTSAILKERGANKLWLGTRGGLFIYDLSSNAFIKQLEGLQKKHVRFIFEDSKNDIWVGTANNGVFVYRKEILVKWFKKEPQKNSTISSNHIISISEDHLGRIWLANFKNGIDIYNRANDSFTHLLHEPFNQQSLGSDNLTYLFFDKIRNYMYVSSRDAGITVVQLGNETKFKYVHINSDNSIDKLSIDYIWSITSKNSDNLYVATIGGGLNILTLKKNKQYQVDYITRSMGLADNDVESVLIDNKGKVWMGGRGLSVYNPKTKKINNYDVNDGLQSNSFKIGSSFYDDKKGIMYFGGVNGVNYFDPNLIITGKIPTDVNVSGIEIFNKAVKIGDTINHRVLLQSKITDTTLIKLKAKENEFSINFTPINFIAPKSNKIRYRLLPYQKNWILRSYPNFKATFANLPAGNYTLEIQSSNKSNIWSDKSTVLTIQIDKYWYKTNIALLIYFAFFVGLLYFYHVQTTTRQKIKEQLRVAEKEQLLNQDKLDFFTKISHEIRTPLTLIAGPLNDLLQNRKTDRSKEEILTSMSRHVNRLLSMVNRLLDFRKMELGYDVLQASPTEINDFAYNIFMFFKGKAFSKIINYEFIKLPKDVTVFIDQEKIETIFINLLSNAFKFTPNNGNVTVKLKLKGSENKEAVFNDRFEPIENYIEMSVIDTGKGIPPEEKDKIFNQYYQIDKNSSFETIGNGIGLALVKSICNLHHLKLTVKSETNKGSRFMVRIPLGKNYLGVDEIIDNATYKKFNTPIVLHQTPTAELDQNSLDILNRDISKNKKVLIVEDNPEISLYLNQHLKKYFRVLQAENGALGFELAMQEKPDIIISDVMMPEMNGMEFAKHIKTNDALHHIPLILVTALTSTEHELEGLKLGIEDYIRKPFDIEVLLAKIFAILENRKYVSEYYSKQLLFTPKNTDELTDDEQFLQKLINFIESNLTNEDLNVNSISQHLALGRTSLYIKIKELTGRSIVEFIRDVRLKKAEDLIMNSSENIEQISYQVGINDLKYFRKHFKIVYCQSPSQYRKEKSDQ